MQVTDQLFLPLTRQLFQTLKIPHDIYHAARTRRILQADQLADEQGEHRDSPERSRRRRLAIAELQRAEMIALVACVVSPLVGAYILSWLQHHLTDGQRYLNQFNIRLFTMAAAIRPWTHAFKLFRRKLLLLQEDVHYPSAKVESLQRRLVRLEADLSSLRKSSVSKGDIRTLRDGIDVPLSQMSRSMRRYEKKEEYMRNSAEDKFGLVEARLEDLLRECAINAELIEAERLERERNSTLGRNVLEAFKYAIGQRAVTSSPRRQDARALPSPGGTGTTASVLQNGWPSSGGAGPGSPPWQQQNGAVVGRVRGNSGGSSNGVAPSMARDLSTASTLPGYTSQPGSPPRYPHNLVSSGIATGAEPMTVSTADGGLPPSQWYERGMLYWAFLPLNLSNSVLRYAGDKLGPSTAASAMGHARSRSRGRKMIGPMPPTSPTESHRAQTQAAAAATGHPQQSYGVPHHQSPPQSQHYGSHPAIHITHSTAADAHPPSAFAPGGMGISAGAANGGTSPGLPGGMVTSVPASSPPSLHSMAAPLTTSQSQQQQPLSASKGQHWKAGGRILSGRGVKA